MSVKSEALILDEATQEGRNIRLEHRRTPELVVAFIGPVGSGVTESNRIFEEILEKEYGYKGFDHKVSDIIRNSAKFVEIDLNVELSGSERIKQFQKAGNDLRKKFGDDYLSRKCIDLIAQNRLAHGGYKREKNEKKEETLIPQPMRFVHLIDALKHPEELKLLRAVYGDLMTLVGVFAPVDVRRDRLLKNGIDRSELDKIISTDEHEEIIHGQKVRETFSNSDLFIRNDKDNDYELRQRIGRYLELIFGVEIHTPTRDEMAMYNAASAASKSACMSRQVGATIYSKSGELIGIGWNDVPKKGGALYSAEDGRNDQRCYLWGGKICHNDDRKNKLYEKILIELKKEKIISGKAAESERVYSALMRTDIRNLIEYSRSIHAEMEAIISVGRSSKAGLVGSTLYSSTFPCHSCARHIVAAGIDKVVYIEPYPKSLAKELHSDALSDSSKDEHTKVVFEQFDGVAPKNVMKFFRSGIDRKKNGKKIMRGKRLATPVFQPALDSFTIYEQRVVEELHEAEKSAS